MLEEYWDGRFGCLRLVDGRNGGQSIIDHWVGPLKVPSELRIRKVDNFHDFYPHGLVGDLASDMGNFYPVTGSGIRKNRLFFLFSHSNVDFALGGLSGPPVPIHMLWVYRCRYILEKDNVLYTSKFDNFKAHSSSSVRLLLSGESLENLPTIVLDFHIFQSSEDNLRPVRVTSGACLRAQRKTVGGK